MSTKWRHTYFVLNCFQGYCDLETNVKVRFQYTKKNGFVIYCFFCFVKGILYFQSGIQFCFGISSITWLHEDVFYHSNHCYLVEWNKYVDIHQNCTLKVKSINKGKKLVTSIKEKQYICISQHFCLSVLLRFNNWFYSTNSPL